MAEVYFSKNIEKILEKINYSKLGEKVAIKLHFGEQGCVTYISPEIVKKIYEKIISLGKKAVLVDCNTLYKGGRTTASKHIKTAKSHGFNFAEIDILDGEKGDEEFEKKVRGKAGTAKIGKGIKKYDSMIVLTHFKGHIASGYGGSFKNIGMGLGSRAGKFHMHSGSKIYIDKEKCVGCGTCVENCNENAISLENNKAEIDYSKCSKCALCFGVCPNNAVKFPRSNSEELDKKIVDYSKAVIEELNSKIIYINVLENITESCDCDSCPQKPIIKDIGILYSENPTAIDKASLDLANKYSNGKFNKINNLDKNIQTDYAEKIGLGEKEYILKKLNQNFLTN